MTAVGCIIMHVVFTIQSWNSVFYLFMSLSLAAALVSSAPNTYTLFFVYYTHVLYTFTVTYTSYVCSYCREQITILTALHNV